MKNATRPDAAIAPKDVPERFISQKKSSSYMGASKTDFGVPLDQVRSALQKAIRRGQEDEAMYWAWELISYGWVKYLWRCLRLFASEDVGVGDPQCAQRIDALAANAHEVTQGFKKGKKGEPHMYCGLAEAQAVIDLCRSPKSWEQTHLLLKIQKEFGDVWAGNALPRQPKEEALDAHTDAGRKRGVTKQQWWAEGEALSPKAPGHHSTGNDPHSSINGDPEVL